MHWSHRHDGRRRVVRRRPSRFNDRGPWGRWVAAAVLAATVPVSCAPAGTVGQGPAHARAIVHAPAPEPGRPGEGHGIGEAGDPVLPGFTPASSAAQRELEARFLDAPGPLSTARTLHNLANQPHLAGTLGGRSVAEQLELELKSLGFEVRVDRYDVYLPHPRRIRIALVAPDTVELNSREPYGLQGNGAVLAERGTTVEPAPAPSTAAEVRVATESEPIDPSALWLNWHAYSANGAVEAPVVYVNYGLPEDYAILDSLGIDVRGKIVLARMGRSYRGVKVRQAELRGAAGVLLFPDPPRSVYESGDTLPVGPHRPSQAVERGTVAYMWHYTGDPLTPGAPSVDGVPRLDPAEARNLPTIPVAPVSYADASRILQALSGPTPASFQGALPIDYPVGPGSARVRLEVEQDFAIRPIYNVIAMLRGEEPGYVVLGNHHDAWIYGGVDAHSGTVVLMDIALGLARLRAEGWQPRRGIVLAFWDAEEFGVVGSTEWVEDHYDELRENAIAYFNIDVFTAGTLDVSGSPSLRNLVLSAAEDVTDPISGQSVADEWRARWPDTPEAPFFTDIGAGSDWTAFLHFAGVPSLQWTMNGRGTYGVYHSVLDDARYHAVYADSGHVYAPVLARVMGLAALRLAQADALPIDYSRYAMRIEEYAARLEAIEGVDAERAGEAARRVRRAAGALGTAAAELEAARARALERGETRALARMNRMLPRIEQAFLDLEGMPGRPWYRHTIYAPDRVNGYGALTLPGIAEALRAGDETALARQLARLEAALHRAANRLRQAADAGISDTAPATPDLD